MSNPDDFDKLICRYIIKGTLTNITQLHIGKGGSETEFSVDNPIITVRIKNDEIPYIPGSSLKGILRSEVEKFLKGQGEKICVPYDPKSKCNNGEIRDICLACQIFGCQQIGSHFIASDAILKMDHHPGVKIKPGIAINRITGSTQKGAFFQIETLQPGGLFDFEFEIFNIDLKTNDKNEKKARAIKFLLKELRDGWIQVGGKKSTGFGRIQFNRINGKLDVKVIEIRSEYFETLEFPEYNLDELLG